MVLLGYCLAFINQTVDDNMDPTETSTHGQNNIQHTVFIHSSIPRSFQASQEMLSLSPQWKEPRHPHQGCVQDPSSSDAPAPSSGSSLSRGQRLYSDPLPDEPASHPISEGQPGHPAEADLCQLLVSVISSFRSQPTACEH